MTIINRQPLHEGPYIFSTTNGEKASSDYSKRKRLLDEASGVTNWTLHDLRRSARSIMPWLNIDRQVARRILNHQSDALDEIYDRYTYAEPKAEALQRLADHVLGLVAAG